MMFSNRFTVIQRTWSLLRCDSGHERVTMVPRPLCNHSATSLQPLATESQPSHNHAATESQLSHNRVTTESQPSHNRVTTELTRVRKVAERLWLESRESQCLEQRRDSTSIFIAMPLYRHKIVKGFQHFISLRDPLQVPTGEAYQPHNIRSTTYFET